MPAAIKTLTDLQDLESQYSEIFNHQCEKKSPKPHREIINYNVNENFKKFSLYTDPSSVTSFNTNASLSQGNLYI